MSSFAKAVGWLNGQIDSQEKMAAAAQLKLDRLRAARDVLAEYAPGGGAPVAEPAKKPRPAPRAKVSPAARAMDRRAAIAAALKVRAPGPPEAASAAVGKCDICPRPSTSSTSCPRGCGRVSRACAAHGGRSLGGRVGGHARKCKAKPKAEPAPAAPEVVASLAPPVLVLRHPNGRAIKGKAGRDRLCRCTVSVENEFGSGGRGLVKTQSCGATVWANNRQKHLHAEHGIISPDLEQHFEALQEPEDDDADCAA